MNILQVNTRDAGGGAEKISRMLHDAYPAYGHTAYLAVGYQITQTPNVLCFPNDSCRSLWARFCLMLAGHLPRFVKNTARTRLANALNYIGQPRRWIAVRKGQEDFDFPGTHNLLTLSPYTPDLLHCHNLHGNYFDLRALASLSYTLPTVLTLHDAWMLSGHCAHSFDCERWKIGCGKCPDLTIKPAIQRDATAYNWQKKQTIYAKSRLYIATPSHWLMQKVERSMLAPALVESRVIPNGVDLSVFFPADKKAARLELQLPLDKKILLFTANSIRQNLWKDYQTMQKAVSLLAEWKGSSSVLFIALGDAAPPQKIGTTEIRFIPYQNTQAMVARYYQAADVYIHAAKVDTFPNTVLEALACGTPVVATAVGGIPEQVEHGKSGFLVQKGNATAMAFYIRQLLENATLRLAIGKGAVDRVRKHFSHQRMIRDYLDWYQEILRM